MEMTFEQFRNLVENLGSSGEFSFGYNWLDYVNRCLNESIIAKHQADLLDVLMAAKLDIRGKTVLDIGCGSGLSSLAFSRLGASEILSVDVDPFSVAATELTKSKFAGGAKVDWAVCKKSVFEGGFGLFDLVYSWGVLHHTGDMWSAIDIAAKSVRAGGHFYVALYRSGPSYSKHLEQKFMFKFLNRDQKLRMLYDYLRATTNPFETDSRGMNQFHDALDWLGGLPYEVCHPLVLSRFLEGFDPVFFRDWNEGGNFVCVFKRGSAT